MRGLALLWMFAAAVFVTGCAGYKLGPAGGQTAGAHTIQINPIPNKTLEPHLSDYLMISLRENLAQDGTYKIDTRDDGDVIMNAVITAYRRTEISSQPTDVLAVLDYEIYMTAQITVRERISGKVLLDKPVTGHTALRAGTDLTSAERQAIPTLTDDLAKRATHLLIDGTW